MSVFPRIAAAMGAFWRFISGEYGSAGGVITRVFEDNFDGLLVIDEDGRIIAASRMASSLLLGPTNGTVVGRSAAEVLPSNMAHTVQQAFADGRCGLPTPMTLARIRDPDRDGYIVQFVANLSEVPHHGPIPKRIVSLTFWDETERRRREVELTFIGTHDSLTGALTRAELVRIIDEILSSERRRATGLTVLIIDLTRVKSVNDLLGHANGDLLLKLAAGRLKAAGIETLARLGANTFAMIRHGRLVEPEVGKFCANLIERVTLPYTVGGQRVLIGAEIGLTSTETSGHDPDVLLSHADLALAAAKASPGNHYVRFTHEMDERLKERRTLDAALRVARDRREMAIFYQPQCSLETGALVGVEAMVRWNHPELGVIAPNRFEPIADENGEIVEIGRWALETACREVAEWPFQTRLAVRVSPVQFEFVDVVAEVRSALSKSGLAPHRLDIEVTESLLASQANYIGDALARLRALGVGIVLREFGVGHCSFGQLRRLPAEKIKISQDFVGSLPADDETRAIIAAIMTMSESLEKIVIAEGVETRDQAWMLHMMGCRIGQGYHFGRPRGGADMANWYQDGSDETARKLSA